MSAGDGRRSAYDAEIIADFRRTYEQLVNHNDPTAPGGKPWTMRLTLEEVGAIIRLADEVVELRRQTVGDWEPDFPPVTVVEVHGADLPTSPEEMPLEVKPYVDAMNATAKRLAESMDIPPHVITTCPHAGTHHSCPLGGCPTFERREVPIPDLPIAGRAERETPPRAWRRLDDPVMAERVARIYLDPKHRAGVDRNRRRPTAHVAEELGVSLRTASRWVSLGRSLGLIPHQHAPEDALDAAFYALDEPRA